VYDIYGTDDGTYSPSFSDYYLSPLPPAQSLIWHFAGLSYTKSTGHILLILDGTTLTTLYTGLGNLDFTMNPFTVEYLGNAPGVDAGHVAVAYYRSWNDYALTAVGIGQNAGNSICIRQIQGPEGESVGSSHPESLPNSTASDYSKG